MGECAAASGLHGAVDLNNLLALVPAHLPASALLLSVSQCNGGQQHDAGPYDDQQWVGDQPRLLSLPLAPSPLLPGPRQQQSLGVQQQQQAAAG